MNIKKILAAVSAVVVMSAGTVCNVSATYPDPNGDGAIDVADMRFVQFFLMGQVNPTDNTALDFNGNGIITCIDAHMIECYVAGTL